MKLNSIKTAAETGLHGIEFVTVDKAIVEVVIAGRIRIRKSESYSSTLQVLVEQPFEEAKRWRMTATIDGFRPAVSYHEHEYEAHDAAGKFPPSAITEIVEVAVLVDERGEVVFNENGEVGVATLDPMDLPF